MDLEGAVAGGIAVETVAAAAVPVVEVIFGTVTDITSVEGVGGREGMVVVVRVPLDVTGTHVVHRCDIGVGAGADGQVIDARLEAHPLVGDREGQLGAVGEGRLEGGPDPLAAVRAVLEDHDIGHAVEAVGTVGVLHAPEGVVQDGVRDRGNRTRIDDGEALGEIAHAFGHIGREFRDDRRDRFERDAGNSSYGLLTVKSEPSPGSLINSQYSTFGTWRARRSMPQTGRVPSDLVQ